MNIQPGFILKLTTWENDADAYRTTEHTGLDADTVRFMIEVAELFYSCNNGGKYGNSDRFNSRPGRRNDDNLVPDVKAIVDKYKEQGIVIPEEFDYTSFEAGKEEYHDDWMHDVLYDLIGTWCDGEYWRVFESFRVFHLPAELVDVTNDFKKED